ncbi:MAG: hypothetical protein AAFY56_06275 [Pseudomonadota bacterium]
MTDPSRRRGASLIVVIWVTTIVAGMAVAFLRDTGTDQLRLRNLADEIQADAIIDAALARTVLALVLSETSWPADEAWVWAYDAAEITIETTPEIGRIDLNQAPIELFEVVLNEFDWEEEQITALLTNIAEARGEELETDEDRLDFDETEVDETEPNEAEEENGDLEDDETLVEDESVAPALTSLREVAGLLDGEFEVGPEFFDQFTIFTGAPLPEMALLEPRMRTLIDAAEISVEPELGEEETETDPIEEEDETEEEGVVGDLEEFLQDEPSLAELAEALGSSAIFRVDLRAKLANGFRRDVRIVVTLDNQEESEGYRVLDWQPITALEDEARP